MESSSDSGSAFHTGSETDELRDDDASETSDGASPLKETERALRNVARALFIPMTKGREDASSKSDPSRGRALWRKMEQTLGVVSAFKELVSKHRQKCCEQVAALRAALKLQVARAHHDGGDGLLETNKEMRELKKQNVEKAKNLLFVVKIRPYSVDRDSNSEISKRKTRESDYEGVNVTEAKPCLNIYQVVVSNCYGWATTFNVTKNIGNWTLGDDSRALRAYLTDNPPNLRANVQTTSDSVVKWPDVYFERIKTLKSNEKLFKEAPRVKHFDDIHPPVASPEENFAEVQPLVEASIQEDGGDTVIIAYGKRNSGKTYTLHDTESGVTSSIAKYIFEENCTVRCKFLEFSIKAVASGNGSYVYADTYSYLKPSSLARKTFSDVPDISSHGHPFRTWVTANEQADGIYTFSNISAFDAAYASIIKSKTPPEGPQTQTHRFHFVTVIEILKKETTHNPANKKIYLIDLFDENEEDLKLELGEIIKSGKNTLEKFLENGEMKKLNATMKKELKGVESTAAIVHAIDGRDKQNKTLRNLLRRVVEEGDEDEEYDADEEGDVDEKGNGLLKKGRTFVGRLATHEYGTAESTGNQRFAQSLDWVLRSRNEKPTRGLVFMCLDPYDEKGSAETLDLLPWVQNGIFADAMPKKEEEDR